MITFPAYLWPPIWDIKPTSASMLRDAKASRKRDWSMGPRIPQRWSRPPWPHINTVGFVIGSTGGRWEARVSSRVSAALCSSVRPAWAGCSVRDLRYAVTKAEYASLLFGIDCMRLKDGNSNTDVVFCAGLVGKEESVVRTLLKGYIPRMISNMLSREWRGRGDKQTSKAFPPLPITPFNPRIKSPESDSSSSIRLVQSSFPVHTSTCSVYGAIVWRRGVLRSISRSGGVPAHAHPVESHVGWLDAVRPICQCVDVVVKVRIRET